MGPDSPAGAAGGRVGVVLSSVAGILQCVLWPGPWPTFSNWTQEICNFLAGCGFELKDEFRDEESGKNYWFLSSSSD